MQTSIDWSECLFGLDLETTHLKSKRGGILECAIVHLRSGARRTWLVDPRPCEFDPGAIRVNGLTPESLDQPRTHPVQMLRELMRWIRVVRPAGRVLLVGRNPQFDWRFLRRAARRLHTEEQAFFDGMFHRRMLDTHSALMAVAIARGWEVDTDRIDDLYRRLGLEPERQPHGAERGALHGVTGLELIVHEIANGGRAV